VHVIVNRVSHDDGRAANLGRDRRTLSRWAEDYERNRGRIQCRNRVENNRRRAAGERKVYDEVSPSKAQYHRPWRELDINRRTFNDRTHGKRENFETTRSAAEAKLYAETKSIFDDARQQIDDHQRKNWSELYKQQKSEREQYADTEPKRAELEKFHRAERSDYKKCCQAEFKNLNRNAQRYYSNQVKAISQVRTLHSGRIGTGPLRMAMGSAAIALARSVSSEENRSGGSGNIASEHDPYLKMLRQERERSR